LKELGYREIVLVGHSAGGLLARQFVEDHAKSGVTKVIQVCTPNGGTSWGGLRVGVRQPQEAFLKSLTHKARQRSLEGRADKKVPKDVECVSIVGRANFPQRLEVSLAVGDEGVVHLTFNVGKLGDGVVSCIRQWPEDLQEQGIPAVLLEKDHFSVMYSKALAEKIAELVREKQGRWDAQQVADARRRILGGEK
jgi:pimeloyl-ACP methyl ester carboxylesterase